MQRQIVLESYICPFTFLFGFIRISAIDCRIRTSISQPMDLNLKHLSCYINVYLSVPLWNSVFYSTCKNHDNRHITRMLSVLTLDRMTNNTGHLLFLWSFLRTRRTKEVSYSFLYTSILISKTLPESVGKQHFSLDLLAFTHYTGEVMKSSSQENLDRALRNLFKAGFALSQHWTR